MKQILLMMMVAVVLVGCGTTKVDPNAPAKISDPIVEKEICEVLRISAGELTNADLTNVTELTLWHEQLTNKGVEDVAKLQQLKKLGLGGNPITDACLKDLAKLRNLEILRLSNTKITDKGAAELRKALPKCKIFHSYQAD